MKHIFAFENGEAYHQHEAVVERFRERITEYQKILETDYELYDLPKGIVWTSEELATTFFSELPIPAFTNEDTIYFSPDLSAWRSLFLKQLEGKEVPKIKSFYENLSENHVLTIVGHELTHHSDLFVDEFDEEREDSIWFEEGMCDYLSSKHLLSATEFEEITEVECELVDVFKDKYGDHSLDDFGATTYEASLTRIMFDYWRSFLAVKFLVEERYDHDINQVFNVFHRWHDEGRTQPLTEHFNLNAPFL
ncbi:hypothetical protein [Thalassobacillus sp. CUG 92003]|uniref:hypothetical protein n=1 Tax=Thalassobacillus sp. CUG 92003 TaxID=2736641 RepID=UPI0015E79B7E|nr:hypothetical protein [Thalassobacillus sp. CUG 92003]